jgi:hypothetical protein
MVMDAMRVAAAGWAAFPVHFCQRFACAEHAFAAHLLCDGTYGGALKQHAGSTNPRNGEP